MRYAEYIRSPYWVARKAAIIRARGYRCERCGKTPNTGLHLHHRTYVRLFREHPDDLELLCWDCHEQEHDIGHGDSSSPMDPFAVEEVIRRQYPYGEDE